MFSVIIWRTGSVIQQLLQGLKYLADRKGKRELLLAKHQKDKKFMLNTFTNYRRFVSPLNFYIFMPNMLFKKK